MMRSPPKAIRGIDHGIDRKAVHQGTRSSVIEVWCENKFVVTLSSAYNSCMVPPRPVVPILRRAE